MNKESIEGLENSLFKSLSRWQQNVMMEGTEFIKDWLTSQADFDQAVDFLFSKNGIELIERYKGRFAFDIVSYAIDCFYQTFEEDGMEIELANSDTEITDDKADFKKRVAEYFGC